jgi:hypothetical protein
VSILIETKLAIGKNAPAMEMPSNEMDIDTPCVQSTSAELRADMPQIIPEDVTATKKKVEYLAAKLQAIGNHVMSISALSIEMRTIVILHRAIEEFKSRYKEGPSIGLILQTLHVSDNLRSLEAKHSLICGLCKFSSSGGANTIPSLSQSILLLVLHFDMQHIDRLDLAATLQRGQILDFFQSLIVRVTWDRRSLQRLQRCSPSNPKLLLSCFIQISGD